MFEWQTDVLVVGSGGAGLAAALASAEQGLEVVLVEKAKDPIGSNTSRSGGMIMAAGSRFQRAAGINETPEDMARDIFAKNGNQSDPDITMTLCRTAPQLVEWLVDYCQCKLEFVPDFKYPGHTEFRMHAPPSRTGRELVTDLLKRVQSHDNITYVPHTSVTRLLTDDTGAVIGATLNTSGQEDDIGARKVILACNGFAGNRQLLQKYIPHMVDAYYYGAEGNTGEAIIWGEELGAALDYMEAYQAHSSVAYPHGTLVTWAVTVHGGIIVNRQGRRFANEDLGYSAFARHILAQDEGLGYVIFDQRIFDLCQSFAELRETFEAGAIRGPEQDLAALAARMHIDADGLQQTVEAYNKAMTGGGDDEFGRVVGHALSGPFYGVQVTGALFHTQGGLRVNTSAQVLRPNGEPIANLYAAGGAAAGISGTGADGYFAGNGLLTALGLGFIAGRHAAAELAQA